MVWFVYILLCNNKTYYIGLTSDLNRRLKSHQSGYNLATNKYQNIQFVYQETFQLRKDAEIREIQLKRWTVAKKKALIEGNLTLLKQLSKTQSLVEV